MPLKGEAKRDYHRNYMRQHRQALAVAKEQAKATVQTVLTQAALVSQAQVGVSRDFLRELLEQEGPPIVLTMQTIRALHAAERPYGRDATPGPDNDARARACELALRLHERAGTIPTAPVEGRGGGGVSVEIVFVMPGQPQDVVVEAEATVAGPRDDQ